MGIKPVDTDKFVAYLKSLGLVYIRTESSHDLFDYPDGKAKLDRPVSIRINKDKQIPILHIHTNLSTIGKTHKNFEDWLKKPKKKLKADKTKKNY